MVVRVSFLYILEKKKILFFTAASVQNHLKIDDLLPAPATLHSSNDSMCVTLSRIKEIIHSTLFLFSSLSLFLDKGPFLFLVAFDVCK